MRALTWLRAQPDRPFVILFAHCLVVLLYLTGHAVSKVPFSDHRTESLITSDIAPVVHAVAAMVLLVAILSRKWRGEASGISLFVWACTTAALYFTAHQRVPQLAYWAFAMSLVITVAAFLMVARWGVDGDDSGVR